MQCISFLCQKQDKKIRIIVKGGETFLFGYKKMSPGSRLIKDLKQMGS